MRPSSAPPAAAAHAVTSDILAELTAGLAAGDDLREMLVRFLSPVTHIAGASGGAVRILDPHDKRMHLVGEIGLPQPVLEAERAVEEGCGACGEALAGKQPLWAEDLSACARRSEGRYFGSGCRRLLAVPLQHRGRVLGLFNLFFESGREPGADVMALLKTIGELLGLALDNARLERDNLRATVASERQAMAAEVHDSLGQSLAFVKMRLPLLQDAITQCDRASAERYFEDVRAAVGQAHASLRSMLTHLRTPIDPLGLAHALEAGAEAFRRSAGMPLAFVNELPSLRLPPEQEAQVFHIVQEALTNIARHARADHAWVHVAPGEQPGGVRIVVQDDGAGLLPVPAGDAGAAGSHYGMAIMLERARRLGGTLSVGPRRGGGTCVRLDFTAPEASLQQAPAGAEAS
ncbi:MAG: GAF domain-containing protein [Burkholderiales bacterium]|nr:GAF domain-containing protein [Burkholderiales bacterium]